MKVNFNKQTLYTLIIGMCVGAVTIMATLVLTGGVPWLRAAGVGTGAPDVNARYLDGYTTATTVTANSIYISETTTGYLPDNSVDSGAIVTDAVGADEIVANAVGTSEIADGSISVSGDLNLSTDGATSGLDADLLDGLQGSSYFTSWTCEDQQTNCAEASCWANIACSSGYLRAGPCFGNSQSSNFNTTASISSYNHPTRLSYNNSCNWQTSGTGIWVGIRCCKPS